MTNITAQRLARRSTFYKRLRYVESALSDGHVLKRSHSTVVNRHELTGTLPVKRSRYSTGDSDLVASQVIDVKLEEVEPDNSMIVGVNVKLEDVKERDKPRQQQIKEPDPGYQSDESTDTLILDPLDHEAAENVLDSPKDRINPAKAEPLRSQSDVGMFHGLHFHLLGMPRRRLNLLSERIMERDGAVSHAYSNSVTHILSDIHDVAKLQFMLTRGKIGLNARVLDTKWLADALQHGFCPDEQIYLIYPKVTAESPESLKTSENTRKSPKQLRNHFIKRRKSRYESSSDTEKDDKYRAMESDSIELDASDEEDGVPEIESKNHTIASSTQHDDLNKIIEQVKAQPELIDLDASEDDGPEQKEKDDNAEMSRRRGIQYEKFLCMKSNPIMTDTVNPNEFIIEKLEELHEFYKSTNDHWREVGYQKAISAIKTLQTPLRSADEARRIFGVGGRIADKIGEIINTGQLQKLKNLDSENEVLKLFSGIYGVGPSLARRWMSKGYTTLDDIRNNVTLPESQRIGLKYYDELHNRMSREEVEQIAQVVKNELMKIDEKLEMTIGGSYRRGLPDCGDVDLLITRNDEDGKNHQGVMKQLLKRLVDMGFITNHLALPGQFEDLRTRYMGICALPNGLHRHIDILTVPYNEMGACLIAYTGNDIFNRSLRLLASKKKLRLNQMGLFAEVLRGASRAKITEGNCIASKTEEAIFEALGVPCRPPHERNP
ncbi:hypothetical protein BZG36_03307 [Bifiguratus adelaidae]|uniref:DNA polymerase lambda n=1 Tax=Bifiguratus adelaidae TaxID=1938954 RepID=A0A261XZC9_9FUNG|nr:hypothetical protein BZG36_03307 [Bifiguratus adelaidae]